MAESPPLPPISLEAMVTDHLDIGSRYLAAVEKKLVSTGYRSDAEMRTDTLFGLAHIMADIAQSLHIFIDASRPETPPAAPEPATTTAPRQQPTPKLQTREIRTCELCGREGTQRYVKTATGYKCAPTAQKCVGNQAPVLGTAERQPQKVVPEVSYTAGSIRPPRTEPPQPSIPVTARCNDCPRAWTLTGRPLELAVEMHELKHSHIVKILEEA